MTKKKPQTIADLKINLTFSKPSKSNCPTFTDFEIKLKQENPELINYRIKPGVYNFRIRIPIGEEDSKVYYGAKVTKYDWITFQIEVKQPILQGDETYLFSFLYRINYNIYLKMKNDEYFCTELDYFQREYDDSHYLIELGIPF